MEKKLIIKYSFRNEDWIENNVYNFHFQEDKCVHIVDLNPDWEELRTDLIRYNEMEIFGTFKGYSRIDNKSVWVIDLIQLQRDIILNKILPK